MSVAPKFGIDYDEILLYDGKVEFRRNGKFMALRLFRTVLLLCSGSIDILTSSYPEVPSGVTHVKYSKLQTLTYQLLNS